jgi:hypothetical protein
MSVRQLATRSALLERTAFVVKSLNTGKALGRIPSLLFCAKSPPAMPQQPATAPWTPAEMLRMT